MLAFLLIRTEKESMGRNLHDMVSTKSHSYLGKEMVTFCKLVENNLRMLTFFYRRSECLYITYVVKIASQMT